MSDHQSEMMDRAGLSFGAAIHLLKGGKRVARAGWNGKGMWLAYCPGYPDGVPANVSGAHAMRVPLGTPIKVLPYIAMKTADNAMVPWLASQTDMLAEDWMEVAP